MAQRADVRQRPRNKSLYNNRSYVADTQTGMFLRQRENTAIIEEVYLRGLSRCVTSKACFHILSECMLHTQPSQW
jgi:hypothetical protein